MLNPLFNKHTGHYNPVRYALYSDGTSDKNEKTNKNSYV